MYVSPSAPPMSRPPLTTGARIIISLRAVLCFSPMHTLPRPLQSGTFPILNPKKRRSRMLSEITEQLRDQAAIEWRSDSSSIWKLIGIKQFVGLGIQLGPCLWAASNKQGKGKTKSYPCKWNRVIADLMSHGHWTHECLHLRLHRVWACPLPAERWEPLSGVPEETSGPQERPAHRARMLPRRTQQKSQINASPFSGHWTINRRQLWWLGWWDYLPRRDVHTASTTMLRKWKRKIGLWWKGRRLRQRKFTNLICYLRKVEKEKQNKPRVSKRREIRGETNETIHNGENEHWEERALREGKYNAKLCQQRALEGLQGSERSVVGSAVSRVQGTRRCSLAGRCSASQQAASHTSSGPGIPGLCCILGHCTHSSTEVNPSPAGWGANFQACSFLGHFPSVLKAAAALLSWLFLLSSESSLTG